jgi:hypothetical protein
LNNQNEISLLLEVKALREVAQIAEEMIKGHWRTDCELLAVPNRNVWKLRAALENVKILNDTAP